VPTAYDPVQKEIKNLEYEKKKEKNLIAKTAHSGTDRLLYNFKGVMS
jgi:hypothetical protein